MTLAEPVAPLRPWLARAGLRPLSGHAAVGSLLFMATISAGLRIVLTRQVSSPFVFMDELGYERMAQTFAHTGRFSLFGSEGLAYSPLYPIVISPIYAFTSSAQVAYEWVKALNVLFVSLSVFPIYGIARTVLTRPRAVGACALSLLLPLMFYANLEMSEGLAYLLFLVSVWSILRTIRQPNPLNDLLVLATIALSAGVRLQNVALLPAALTAVALVPLARAVSVAERLRSVGLASRRHWLLYGSFLVLLGWVLVKRAINGGSLPIAGRYSNVGTTNADALRVVELAFRHLVELDLALGVVPFAGAMLAAYAVIHFGFPSRQVAFAATAVSISAWFLLEVGYDAAAFDVGGSMYATARIHERYLIYLQPLFVIAFVAALRAARPRVSWRTHLAIAAAAAIAPAAIPFSRVVNFTVPIDTFGLELFTTTSHGKWAPVPHAAIVGVCVGAFFSLAFLYAVLRPRPSFAIVMSVFSLLLLSLAVQVRMRLIANQISATVPTHGAWVDAAARGEDVILVGGTRKYSSALLLTTFRNFSITRVYATCTSVFGSDFGERRAVAGAGGELLDGSERIRASYVLAPVNPGIRGRVVARQPRAGLELVAPTGGVVRVQGPFRCRNGSKQRTASDVELTNARRSRTVAGANRAGRAGTT